MPETKQIKVKDLTIDLSNFRTVRQKSEAKALEAMVSTSPDRFWALMDSLLSDGYLPTENIIALKSADHGKKIVVREGNRRVAALKLALGILSPAGLAIPEDVEEKISNLSAKWKRDNQAVPSTIYDATDAITVDRIVAMTHGKNEKAGRDQWNAVARARHNRDVGKNKEPALDLLEAYLAKGKNITDEQKARWAGAYPLSVLAEAMKKIAPRIGLATAPALAKKYPNSSHNTAIEAVLKDIGTEVLRFDGIRGTKLDDYGFPTEPKAAGSKANISSGASPTTAGEVLTSKTRTKSRVTTKSSSSAVSITDVRSVKRHLKSFVPHGKNREKVVALKEEAIALNIGETPMAFCFVLRSLFEISAKAYCDDHKAAGGPSALDQNNKDRPLKDLLGDITKHLTAGGTDTARKKQLHGAMTELAKPTGILSVTSMNQLVHNPNFSVVPGDVAVLFGNVLPLLQEMN